MLKITGLIMVFTFFGFSGIYFYRYTLYCVNYVEGIIGGLKSLRREIEFSESFLNEAFINSSVYSGEAKKLFEKCSFDLSGYREHIREEKVNTKTKDICIDFFGQIGKNNLNNELLLIDVTVSKLETLYWELKKYSENTGKLFGKSGFLIGTIVVILLT